MSGTGGDHVYQSEDSTPSMSSTQEPQSDREAAVDPVPSLLRQNALRGEELLRVMMRRPFTDHEE